MKLLTELEAAHYLGVSVAALRDMRHRGVVPAAQVTLRRAMYDLDDIEELVRRYEPQHASRTYSLSGTQLTIVYDDEETL